MSIMKECREVDLLEFLTEATYELDYLLNFQQDTSMMINNSLGDGLHFIGQGKYEEQQIYSQKLEQRLAEEQRKKSEEEQMIFRFQEQQRLLEEQNRAYQLHHQLHQHQQHQQLSKPPTPAPLYREQPLMPTYASRILSYSGSQFDEVMIEYMPIVGPVYNQFNHAISGTNATFKPQPPPPPPPYLKQNDPARHQREAVQHQQLQHNQQQVYTNFQMNQSNQYSFPEPTYYSNQVEGYQESSNQPSLETISSAYHNRPRNTGDQVTYVLSEKTSTSDQIT